MGPGTGSAAMRRRRKLITEARLFNDMKTRIKIREAPGLLALLMRLVGIHGWIMPWGIIYVRPGRVRDRRLIAHKMMHIEQMDRDGRLLFSARYVWWLLRHGYERHPYEVEARRAEEAADGLRLY